MNIRFIRFVISTIFICLIVGTWWSTFCVENNINHILISLGSLGIGWLSVSISLKLENYP